MAAKDPELDKIEQALKQGLGGKADPYIEKPPQLSIGDGTSCWLDQQRMCGPDCRAYDFGVQPAEGPSVCTLLATAMTAAENLERLVEVGGLLKKRAQDVARTASTAVPDPTGGRKL